jgi:response regulator RpfG family c-di-GMP phosphodiesterase
VKTIIFQHHEKFDGSGYPKKIQGFKVDDISQLLAIADLLDTIVSGQFDGTPKTLKEAFDAIERSEKLRTFPEYFNPDVYSAVLKWTKNTLTGQSARTAIEAIRSQTLKLIDRAV